MSLIEDRGVTGPWDTCLEKLQADGYIAACVQDIVRKRVETNRKSCSDGSWTAENFNYLKGGEILISSRQYNSLIPKAKEARQAHERNQEFWLEDETVDELVSIADEDEQKPPEARQVFRLDRNDSYVITLPTLPHDEFMQFLIKDDLKSYCDILKTQGARGMRVQVLDRLYVARQQKAFAKAMWFDDLRSGFVGNTDLTHYNPGRLYGIPWSEVFR